MKLYPLRMFVKGFVLSACVSSLLFIGMTMTCKYLPGSVLFPAGLILVCSFLMWMVVRFERIADQVERISSTVSFDFIYSHAGLIRSMRLFRPLVPYIIVLLSVIILYFVFIGVPSTMVCLIAGPERSSDAVPYGVFFVNTGLCLLYYAKNRKGFSSITEKAAFFAGVASGQAGAAIIIASYFFQ